MPGSLSLPALLSCCFWISAAVAADSRAQFTLEPASCPAGDLTALTVEGSIRQITGAQDKRACLVECSLWPQCVAVHHSPASATCRLGTLKAWLQAWQAAGTAECVSYTRPPPLPASLQAKLLMFYNFRFGLANQANASAFPVTLGTVLQSKLGLQLFGNYSSKAEVDLMGRGISQYVSPALREITFYVKVSALYDYVSSCFHVTYNRTIGSADNLSGKWCRSNSYDNKILFLARRLIPTSFTSGGGILPSDTVNTVTYSTAVSFSSSVGARFFYNGVMDPLAPTSDSSASAGPLGDDGLAIGYDIYSPFKGLIHCYGVAAAALTEAEVAILDGLC